MGQIEDDPDQLQREIGRASRLASAVTDPTTYQRLKQFVEELRQSLHRRLAARRAKEAIRARALLLAEREFREAENQLSRTEDLRLPHAHKNSPSKGACRSCVAAGSVVAWARDINKIAKNLSQPE